MTISANEVAGNVSPRLNRKLMRADADEIVRVRLSKGAPGEGSACLHHHDRAFKQGIMALQIFYMYFVGMAA